MEQTANNKEALIMPGMEPIKIQNKVDEAVAEIGKVVLGKEKQIRLSLCCLFAGGHIYVVLYCHHYLGIDVHHPD